MYSTQSFDITIISMFIYVKDTETCRPKRSQFSKLYEEENKAELFN